MNKQLGITDTVENVLAKLFVLRNSCVNIVHTDKADPDSIWLQGAESILQDAVDELQNGLRARVQRR